MCDPQKLAEVKAAKAKYEETVAKVLTKIPERQAEFVNTSGIPLARVYTPLDMADFDYLRKLGMPGQYPLHPGGAAHRLPGPLLDHAAVCRFRHRRGDQRTLPFPVEVRPDRPLGGLRPAHPDRL